MTTPVMMALFAALFLAVLFFGTVAIGDLLGYLWLIEKGRSK